MNALLYCHSGGGKTVQATRIPAPNRGRNCLLCTDNSHVVLMQPQFCRENLDIVVVEHWLKADKDGNPQPHFSEQFSAAVDSKKYDNIIVDNLSDLFDLSILETEERGLIKDGRQIYQASYQAIKRLTRRAGQLDCNVIFTAWAEQYETTTASGDRVPCIIPKLPGKIMENVLGLCNIVGYVASAEKDGKRQWYYITEDRPNMRGKNQLTGAKSVLPEKLWEAAK